MHAKILISYLLWTLLFECVRSLGNSSLSFVIVLYRHGDRSPIRTFPTDPYQEDFWPQGFEQLSRKGIQQEYALGAYLKQRYIDTNFLNSTYKREEIYVRSTDTDRTIMSAQSVLAGMYKPAGRQIWNDSIPWQPIPIHVRPVTGDSLRPPPCGLLEEEDQKVTDLPETQEFTFQFNDTLELLRNHTGEKLANIWEARQIFDALFCEWSHNLTLPDWFDLNDLWLHLNVILPHKYNLMYKTELQRRLRGGPVITEFIQQLDNYIEAQQNPNITDSPKMIMFSAHDTTLAGVMVMLGIYNDRFVPYSTSLYVEIHESESGDHVIEVWFRNETDHEPYLLTVPGCEGVCPYSKFRKLLEPYIGTDFEKECEHHLYVLGIDLTDIVQVTLLSVGVGLLVLLILLGCVVCCCNRRWRKQRVRAYGRLRADIPYPEEVPMMSSGVGSDDD